MLPQIPVTILFICATTIPLLAIHLLRRPSVRAWLRARGRWLVPLMWGAGGVLLLVPLTADLTGASDTARGAAFLVCLLGPLLAALVLLGVRDARRTVAGSAAPEAAGVSPGVRVACGAIAVLSGSLLANLAWRGPSRDAWPLVPCVVLFGYVALTGRNLEAVFPHVS
jgi:hypothetical protein